MSGGSLDYLYSRVNDAADLIAYSGEPLRCAFAEHLRKVAKALHDVEWVMSCDYGPGDDADAIRACIAPDAALAAALAAASRQLVEALEAFNRTTGHYREAKGS